MTPNVSASLLRTQTDERLVALVAAGHERAFDAIVERYSRPLLRHARRMLREDGRAEDVVQAAFVSAWTALGEGTAVRDLRPWLYRIVHNGALNAMKKPGGADAPLAEAQAAGPGPEVEVLQREDVRRALDTISGLPERQRAALLAVALEGRSHADVGQDLGIDDTAVRQLVSRARRSLRVAATAVTPWPLAVWLAGAGGAQAGDTGARVGEIVGGLGAGTLFGGGAVKAGAIVAATGAVVVDAPQIAQVVREQPRAAHSAPAGAPPAGESTSSDRGGGVAARGSYASGPAPVIRPAAGDERDTTRHEDREQRRDGDEHGSHGDGRPDDEPRQSGPDHAENDDDDDGEHADDRDEPRKRSGGHDEDRSQRRRDEDHGRRGERTGDDARKKRSADDPASPAGEPQDDDADDEPDAESGHGSEPKDDDRASGGSGRREDDRGSDDASVTFAP